MDVFEKNGYRRHQGIKSFKKAKAPHSKQPLDDHVGKVHLPYTMGTTDEIAHIFKKIAI